MRAELLDRPESWPGGQDWFWHGEQVLALIDQYQPKNVVELGSWKGGSAIAMARLVRQWGGTVTCVDTWTFGSPIQECADNLVRAGVAASVRLIAADTQDAADHWNIQSQIDFLYVDADHSYEGCRGDLRKWWPYLRMGGLIAGDDYDDPRYGVTAAWDEFERDYRQNFSRRATPGSDPACTRLIWGIKQ